MSCLPDLNPTDAVRRITLHHDAHGNGPNGGAERNEAADPRSEAEPAEPSSTVNTVATTVVAGYPTRAAATTAWRAHWQRKNLRCEPPSH